MAFQDRSVNASSWLWDFGDNSTTTQRNPVHAYLPGQYDVTLTITNENGTYTAERPALITVTDNHKPIAEFAVNRTGGPAPLVVNFTDQTLNAPSSWLWRFGDGETSTRENPVHVYEAPGRYNVTMQATNSVGTSTVEKTWLINVTNSASPDVNFTANQTIGYAPLVVQFRDASSNHPVSWLWDFDEKGSTQQNPLVVLERPGHHNVTLTAVNEHGMNTLSRTEYVTVLCDPPVASFTSIVNDLNVTFNDTSSGYVETREWDFGDTWLSDQKTPTHTYEKPGNYTVVLTVTNYGGTTVKTGKVGVTVIVTPTPTPSPRAKFTAQQVLKDYPNAWLIIPVALVGLAFIYVMRRNND